MERITRSPEMEFRHSANVLANLFIQRWDIYAVQLDDGRYVCVKEPLQGRQLIRHLKGEITLGAYVLNKNSKARFTVIDADDDVQYYQLFRLADRLAEGGIPSYIEASRRGGHLWLFFDEPMHGLVAKTFGEELLAEYHMPPMEVFPKQEELGQGPGSLIRLPFGVHRKSGKVYPFVNRVDGLPTGATVHDQLRVLREVQTVSLADVDRYTYLALKDYGAGRQYQHGHDRDNVWERIRQAKPAIDFIGRYIELTPTETGGVGYCPFHEDKVKSFGVHRQGNYWHCFAGCGGGSIIDFWMKWKNVDLGEAVHELKDMLGVQ